MNSEIRGQPQPARRTLSIIRRTGQAPRRVAQVNSALGITHAMALSPELRAHFESIGPSGVLLEIAERKHGQAPDSPLWREAMLWVEAQSIKERDARESRMLAVAEESASRATEANRIASEALAASRSNSKWAMYAAVISILALAVATKDHIFSLIFGSPL